jgi:hypothetical protein
MPGSNLQQQKPVPTAVYPQATTNNMTAHSGQQLGVQPQPVRHGIHLLQR